VLSFPIVRECSLRKHATVEPFGALLKRGPAAKIKQHGGLPAGYERVPIVLSGLAQHNADGFCVVHVLRFPAHLLQHQEVF